MSAAALPMSVSAKAVPVRHSTPRNVSQPIAGWRPCPRRRSAEVDHDGRGGVPVRDPVGAERPMTTSLPPAAARCRCREEAEHLVGDGALHRVDRIAADEGAGAPVTPIVPAAVLSAGVASVSVIRAVTVAEPGAVALTRAVIVMVPLAGSVPVQTARGAGAGRGGDPQQAAAGDRDGDRRGPGRSDAVGDAHRRDGLVAGDGRSGCRHGDGAVGTSPAAGVAESTSARRRGRDSTPAGCSRGRRD